MQAFRYDAEVFYRNSTLEEDTATRRAARILKRCHVLEKGLTMPDRRMGFGQENLSALIRDLLACVACGDMQQMHFAYAVKVVAEYDDLHKKTGFALESGLSKDIRRLLADFPAAPAQQPEITRDSYYAKVRAPFDEFSASRHSVRTLSGTVSVEQIQCAVELAKYAPSACNRQPCRVHLVCNPQLIQQCLALQNGNRGFGHLIDKLLILTADLHTVWLNERNDLFTNGGIYLMNLCYALHFNKVAHCILNWSPPCDDPRNPFPADRALFKLLGLPPSERVIAFVACGGLPPSFKMALSSRKKADEVLVVHE